jgi:hypothetical protein
MSKAIIDITKERQLQLGRGWTSEHDDTMEASGELVLGALGYAMSALKIDPVEIKRFWPWKREPPVRDNDKIGSRDTRSLLVKAGALLVAEIERLDRLSEAEQAWNILENAFWESEGKKNV